MLYHPTNNTWKIHFLHILASIWLYQLFTSPILIGVFFILGVVFTCTSLMAGEFEPLFMCLIVICISSSVKSLFMSFVHFLISVFYFILLLFLSFLIGVVNIFSQSVVWLLVFLNAFQHLLRWVIGFFFFILLMWQLYWLISECWTHFVLWTYTPLSYGALCFEHDAGTDLPIVC